MATQGEPSRPKLGFSNLLIRVDERNLFGFAGGDSRVFIIERLRALGFNAVGAENLVFDKDEARSADYVLGATVQTLECRDLQYRINCRVGVEWQLLDVARDAVIYKVVTSTGLYAVNQQDPKGIGKAMLDHALRMLVARPAFRSALKPPEDIAADEPSAEAPFKACTAPARTMPAAFEDVARATVLVRTPKGFGSGFFLSPDGLVLTAAHVVDDAQLEVKQRDGSIVSAKAVRISRASDVALLVVHREGQAETPCLTPNLDPKLPGTEVYAIGAPAFQDLAFSITRGIISGERDVHGTPLLQTDASVSPGNSGGPLVDSQGRAAAVVSRKLAGGGVEGIAFGIPIEVALAALKLHGAAESNPALLAAAPASSLPIKETKTLLFTDAPDQPVSLDPDGDEARAAAARERARQARIDALTPKYIPIMRWTGLSVAILGTLAAVATSQDVDKDRMTKDEYSSLRLKNDLSWVAIGLGSAAFTASFLVGPKLPAGEAAAAPRRSVTLGMGPGNVRLGVGF